MPHYIVQVTTNFGVLPVTIVNCHLPPNPHITRQIITTWRTQWEHTPPKAIIWLVGDFNRHDTTQKDLELLLAEHNLELVHCPNLLTYRHGEDESAIDQIYSNDLGLEQGSTKAKVHCTRDARHNNAHCRPLLRWTPIPVTVTATLPYIPYETLEGNTPTHFELDRRVERLYSET